MRRITVTLVIAAIFIVSAHGQGFVNLNFESAQNLPGNPGADGVSVPVSNALPGWTAYDGSLVLSAIYYVSNSFPGDSTSVELEGGSLALSGNNLSVGLYAGGSISQTGMVPNNAESLEFDAHGTGPGFSVEFNDLVATLGGQTLSFSALFTGPDYVEYGANIPAGMDGQMEALTFGANQVLLDNIEFSSMGVPEPSEYALLGLGAFLFGLRYLRFRNASPSRVTKH